MATHRSPSLEDWSSAKSSSDPNYHSKTHQEQPPGASHHEQLPAAGSEIEQTTTNLDGAPTTSSNIHGTRAKLGLHPTAPIDHDHDVLEQQDWWWPRTRLSLKEPLAEVGHFFCAGEAMTVC